MFDRSAARLQLTARMLDIVADRFVRVRDTWIDLGTGRLTTLRIVAAGTPNDQLLWNSFCAALANLRHPLINPLIDYGLIGRDRRFEAYALCPALRVSAKVADRLVDHARRFLDTHSAPVQRGHLAAVMRRVDRVRCAPVRAVGVVLQHRAVYAAIADALDTTWPLGTSVIHVGGPLQSGMRTTRVIAARLARLRGYIPVDAELLTNHPAVTAFATDRHVCVIADPHSAGSAPVITLLTRLASAGARRHVLLVFDRLESPVAHRLIAIERMGVTAMNGMLFVDRQYGPHPVEIMNAARAADGRPGTFLERLGSTWATYPDRPPVHLTVHETAVPYGDRATPHQARDEAVDERRIAHVLRSSMSRADSLVSHGRHMSATRLLSRASRVLRGRGAARAAAEAAVHQGFLSLDRGMLAAAIRSFDFAREAAPASSAGARAAIGLGLAWIDEGRLVQAEAILRTALVSTPTESSNLRSQAACALARCLYWGSRLDEARLVFEDTSMPEDATEAARMMALRSRLELGEGQTSLAVKLAHKAADIAIDVQSARIQAAAYRALAMALASAGDERAAADHVQSGLVAAAAARLPLAAARLRLTLAEIGHALPQGSARRIVTRIIARNYPPLLQAFARAVLARIDGTELDGWTKSFIASSGAAQIAHPSVRTNVPAVTDLESFLDLGHTAPDDRSAIDQIAALVQSKLRATSVVVVGIGPERRVLSLAGRWPGDPQVAWRAAGAAASIPVDSWSEPCQSAEPIRYCGEVIGAIGVRWSAGLAVDATRSSSILRVASLALAPHARILLEPPPAFVADRGGDDLLGESDSVRTLREAIARAARAPFPVLIQGESGSGKELVARTVHRLGSRRERRFCALNCAALTDELIEAELFGHSRGAFTGAVGERAGLFEEADNGTLFLDEIGELSARAQAKLLRVLQDGEVRRVGENLSRRVDVRIIAATNRRLDQEAAAGRFRSDLRFRLDVIRIEVPPLRDRASDVPMLASRFWTDAAGRVGSRATLGPEAVAALARYEWPGNVRELQNVIAWIAVQSPRRGRIGAAGLPSHIAHATLSIDTTFEAARQEFERRFVKAALAKADGQRARAAEALGITRQGLAKMIRRLGLE